MHIMSSEFDLDQLAKEERRNREKAGVDAPSWFVMLFGALSGPLWRLFRRR